MYKDSSLNKYLDDLAGKFPAPGGGSAAALTAALGQALASMVINFTIGKFKYARFQDDLVEYLEESESLRRKFLDLVDLDVEAFNTKDYSKALEVPLMVARFCFEGMNLIPELVKKGNVNLISDVAVAAQLLESAFCAACVNVEINLEILGNKKLAMKLRKELAKKEKVVKRIRKKTEVRVGKIIRR